MRSCVALLAALLSACAARSATAVSTGASLSGPDRATAPDRGPPPPLKVPPQKHFVLANGLKVRFVEHSRLPIVALNLVVNAGGLHDPMDRPGLANFTASMLTEGTRTRSAIQISDDLGGLGAELSSRAGFDSAQVAGVTLASHLETMFEIMSDVVVAPSFPQADFARVQDERLVALVQQQDVPRAVAAKAFAKAFWGSSPYGHWVMGDEASIRATTRSDLSRFHDKYWRPGNAELVVVGDVSRAELESLLDRTFARWKAGPTPAPLPVASAPPAKRTIIIDKREATQTYLLMGMPAVERASPDLVPLEVGLQILGGGSTSRIYRNLREKHGYTYGIFSVADTRKLGGATLVVGSVESEATGASMKELLAEIEGMQSAMVTPDELEIARSSIVLQLPAQFSTAAGIADRLAEEVVYALPDEYWNRYADAVQKVTASDVQRVMRKHLALERLLTVMVGQSSSVRDRLKDLPLGPIEVRSAPVR